MPWSQGHIYLSGLPHAHDAPSALVRVKQWILMRVCPGQGFAGVTILFRGTGICEAYIALLTSCPGLRTCMAKTGHQNLLAPFWLGKALFWETTCLGFLQENAAIRSAPSCTLTQSPRSRIVLGTTAASASMVGTGWDGTPCPHDHQACQLVLLGHRSACPSKTRAFYIPPKQALWRMCSCLFFFFFPFPLVLGIELRAHTSQMFTTKVYPQPFFETEPQKIAQAGFIFSIHLPWPP